MVKVAHPPVLQAGLLAPVRALVLVDIGGRPQHPLCDHGVVVLPQVGQLGHLVHVHSIDVPLPGDVRVHFLIIGRLDDPERRLKQFLIPAAVFFRPARDRHPDIAHTPDDILPGLLVQLFIPGNVVGPLQKESMDARPQQVDVVVLIPHIDIVQGDAVVVQLPDDHGDIVAEAGRLQQQLVDLVGHAAVLAVGIVEQPARRLFQLGDVAVGQRFRIPRVDQLSQQGVVLLHQVETAHRVALDRLQQEFRSRFRRELRAGEGPHPAKILDIALPFLPIRLFHPDASPFRSKLEPFCKRFRFYYTVHSGKKQSNPTNCYPPPTKKFTFFERKWKIFPYYFKFPASLLSMRNPPSSTHPAPTRRDTAGRCRRCWKRRAAPTGSTRCGTHTARPAAPP